MIQDIIDQIRSEMDRKETLSEEPEELVTTGSDTENEKLPDKEVVK